MSKRAEELAARVWRCARASAVQCEAALEAALAAALECPEVWSRVRASLDLSTYPETLPGVLTQTKVETGRTDITLVWPEKTLVLELKIEQPPGADQIAAYLETGADVVAIAKYPGWVDVAASRGAFRGVVTWATLRTIDWPGAPLVWRQLQALIDELEVAVQRVSLELLQGVVGAWNANEAVAALTRPAVEAASELLTREGFPCVLKESRRKNIFDDTRRLGRMVWWTWPVPWEDADAFSVYTGLVVSIPEMPSIVPGVPDIILAVHSDPGGTGHLAADDEVLRSAADRWALRGASADVRREQAFGTWNFLRARSSSLILVQAQDQAARITEWVTARVQEWIEDGVVDALAGLNRRRSSYTAG